MIKWDLSVTDCVLMWIFRWNLEEPNEGIARWSLHGGLEWFNATNHWYKRTENALISHEICISVGCPQYMERKEWTTYNSSKSSGGCIKK